MNAMLAPQVMARASRITTVCQRSWALYILMLRKRNHSETDFDSVIPGENKEPMDIAGRPNYKAFSRRPA
jgi:hypothetical protein